MRKIFLSLLLVTTAVTPALAQRTTAEERAKEREEREAKRSDARKERTEAREQRSDAPQKEAREQRVDDRQQVREQRQQVREQNLTVRDRSGAAAIQRNSDADARRAAMEARQQQRQETRDQRIESRQQYVDRANQVRQRVRPPANARPDRPAPLPPTASNNVKVPKWSNSWRNDNRYDWRRYRDRNRSLFNLGFYFDPFGWNYRRYNVGWRLWPSYYERSYWLDDPYMYRLPYAPWPYKWVRYYDDAMLVNTYTGEVVDVMYQFFW